MDCYTFILRYRGAIVNGMKNRRILNIFVLGAIALLLASCTLSVQPAPPSVRNFTFQSSWRINGTNQPVSCENLDTVFEYTFYAENPALVTSITEHYEGVQTGRKTTATNNAFTSSGNTVTGTASFRADGAFLPLAADSELDSQAIEVIPIVPPQPADKRGATRFWIVVEYGGLPLTFTSPVRTIDAYANCTPAN